MQHLLTGEKPLVLQDSDEMLSYEEHPLPPEAGRIQVIMMGRLLQLCPGCLSKASLTHKGTKHTLSWQWIEEAEEFKALELKDGVSAKGQNYLQLQA